MCNGNHPLEKTAGESSAKVFFVMVLPGGIPGYLVGMSLFRYRTLSRHFCWGLSLDPDFPNVHNRLDRTPHELAVLK